MKKRRRVARKLQIYSQGGLKAAQRMVIRKNPSLTNYCSLMTVGNKVEIQSFFGLVFLNCHFVR